MTIDQLKVIRMIIESGSFKAASMELGRSQPAISIAVKNLEEELGFKIFSRAHFKASLTETGDAFFQKAKVILEEIEKLENFSRYISEGHEHTVKIGVEVLCQIGTLNPVLSSFPTKFSNTKLKIEYLQVGEAVDKLLDGEIDMAISSLVKKNPKIEETPFSMVNMLAVISNEHPLAFVKNDLSDAELREHVQVAFDKNGEYSVSSQFGIIENSTIWNVCDLNICKQMIMEGFGWGYLPQSMIMNELEKGALIRLRSRTKKQNKILLKGLRKQGVEQGKVKTELWNKIRLLGTSNVQII